MGRYIHTVIKTVAVYQVIVIYVDICTKSFIQFAHLLVLGFSYVSNNPNVFFSILNQFPRHKPMFGDLKAIAYTAKTSSETFFCLAAFVNN